LVVYNFSCNSWLDWQINSDWFLVPDKGERAERRRLAVSCERDSPVFFKVAVRLLLEELRRLFEPDLLVPELRGQRFCINFSYTATTLYHFEHQSVQYIPVRIIRALVDVR